MTYTFWPHWNAHRDAIQFWNLQTGRLSRTISQQFEGHSLAFSPNGLLFACSGREEIRLDAKAGLAQFGVRLYDTQTGGLLWQRLSRQSEFVSVAFSPDGRTLATRQESADLQLWDVATGALKKTLPLGSGDGAVIFSPDGSLLASTCGDERKKDEILTGRIVLWDTKNWKTVKTLLVKMPDSGLAFSPDGKWLACAGNMDGWSEEWGQPDANSEISVFNVANGKPIWNVLGHDEYSICDSVAFSRDGKMLAVGGDEAARIFQTEHGRLLDTLKVWGHRGVSAATTNGVAFSPDGKTLASRTVGKVSVWDTSRLAHSN